MVLAVAKTRRIVLAGILAVALLVGVRAQARPPLPIDTSPYDALGVQPTAGECVFPVWGGGPEPPNEPTPPRDAGLSNSPEAAAARFELRPVAEYMQSLDPTAGKPLEHRVKVSRREGGRGVAAFLVA